MSCIACNAVKKKDGKIEILNYSQYENGREVTAYMENIADGVRLHISDGFLHATKCIYFCPFCGKDLTK